MTQKNSQGIVFSLMIGKHHVAADLREILLPPVGGGHTGSPTDTIHHILRQKVAIHLGVDIGVFCVVRHLGNEIDDGERTHDNDVNKAEHEVTFPFC